MFSCNKHYGQCSVDKTLIGQFVQSIKCKLFLRTKSCQNESMCTGVTYNKKNLERDSTNQQCYQAKGGEKLQSKEKFAPAGFFAKSC